jgi:lipoprotein-releasing system permease protein
VRGVLVRGVDPQLETSVADFAKHMRAAASTSSSRASSASVLGADLATRLNISVGERVMLVTPQAQVTPIGAMPRSSSSARRHLRVRA